MGSMVCVCFLTSVGRVCLLLITTENLWGWRWVGVCSLPLYRHGGDFKYWCWLVEVPGCVGGAPGCWDGRWVGMGRDGSGWVGMGDGQPGGRPSQVRPSHLSDTLVTLVPKRVNKCLYKCRCSLWLTKTSSGFLMYCETYSGDVPQCQPPRPGVSS